MNKPQTLHSHTTNSDGQFSHKELLEKCKTYNIGTVAFTDHDAIIKPEQVESIKNEKDIKWISGIEISSGLPIELGGNASSSFHIVGLFVDYNNPKLIAYCKKAKARRIERMQRMVKNLNRIGFKITEEDCLNASGGELVARPHIVTALLSYDENMNRMLEIKEELRKASETNQDLLEIYTQVDDEYPERWAYPLFMTEWSFINDVYVDYLYYLNMDESVALIRQAGGIAILAHYFTVANKLNTELLEKILTEKRLDGIETVFGLHTYGTPGREDMDNWMRITEDLAEKTHCLRGGGADAHTEKDLKKFSDTKEYNVKTVSLYEDMSKRKELSLQFSNI